MARFALRCLLVFILLIKGTGSFAQFGSLKNKVKEKTEGAKEQKQEESKPPRADAPPESGSTADKAPTSKGKSAGKERSNSIEMVEPDFSSQAFKPAVAWYSLLSDNCLYFNNVNGQFKFNNLAVSFLPTKTKDGRDAGYKTYSKPYVALEMEVFDVKNNVTKANLLYTASPAGVPFHTMELVENKPGYDWGATLTDGSYECRFKIGGVPFYTFPFSIIKVANTDPYAPAPFLYFLRGPWQEWGRVEFGPDEDFLFSYYHTYETTQIENQARYDKTFSFEYMYKLKRNGKVVAAADLNQNNSAFQWKQTMVENGSYNRFESWMLDYPITAQGANAGKERPFKKADLKDGSYTMEVTIKQDGKETTHCYPFTVTGGKIDSDPQANRSVHTDAMTLVEQGRNFVYIRKSKS